LSCKGKGVAQSYGNPDKDDTVDFIRWLKKNGASVPMIGGEILEL
jgi:hypothetical protein